MRKITLLLLVVGLFSFGLNTTAQAQDTSVTLGLKVWYVKYELDLDVEGSEPFEYDEGFMYGPAFNIRFSNFFIGASYLVGGDFTYTEDWTDTDTGLDYEFEENLDRKDLDVSLGFYIHPNVALFLGYKTTELDYEYKNTSEDGDVYGPFDYEWKYKGPAIGISGNIPIGESGSFFYGTLSYVKLSSEYKRDDTDESGEDIKGPAIEFGIGFSPENIPLSFTLGYKYQKYQVDEKGDLFYGWEETFSGVTLGIYYTF